MKHINSLAKGVALGSAGIVLMSVLGGCSQEQQQQKNKFLVIEQLTNGKYVVVEEIPTDGPSRAIIREKDANGNVTERIMSEAEMKTLAQQEYDKFQHGGSELNQNNGGEGMGLAGTILAVAAGSLLGNMIGNALLNNSNFLNKANSVNRSAYHRSAGAYSPNKSGSSAKKSFFGSSSSGSSKKYSGGFFGG
ncbi:hypothetical protein [Sulfurimonas sp. HSL-1716]|uniref:hypothetical protein n=1 Tax=Hydrocurvibacter sulfurireducens TaxID=3131937 RepID=UPI0031F872C4